MDNHSNSKTYFLNENQWGEKFIDEINRNDFQEVRSTDLFEGYMNVNFWKDNTLYLVVGSDSGLLIPYILKRQLGRGSKICLIEPDAVYRIVEREYQHLINKQDNNKTIGSELCLYPESQWKDELLNGSDRSWLLSGEIDQVISRAATADYTNIYSRIIIDSKTAIAERQTALSNGFCRAVFTENQLINAAENRFNLIRSNDFGKGKVALIMGGSPSLDNHLDWIKSHRESLFLIAVSRISNKLIQLEITPDLVVCVDPHKISYEVSKQAILWTDVPLVHNYHASPQLVQEWQGPRLYLGKQLPWHSAEDPRYQNIVGPGGPTVSHAATHIAYHLGFSTILLIGVDLCFDSSVSSHATGSPESILQRLPALCDAQVETYSGRVAGTNMTFLNAAKALDAQGSEINKKTDVLFNLSKDAAKCESIKYLDTSAVNLTALKPDVNALSAFCPPSDWKESLLSLKKDIQIARQAFRKIKSICKEANTCVTKMYGRSSNIKAAQFSQRLAKLDKRMEKEFSIYLHAIKNSNGLQFASVMQPMNFKDMTNSELERWGIQYYSVISSSAHQMIRQINRLEKRIELRFYEESADACFKQLTDRWEQDSTPGRVLKYASRQSTLTDNEKENLQQSIGLFKRGFVENETFIKSTHAETQITLLANTTSLVFLFNCKNLADLKSISTSLTSNEWPLNVLGQFASGLVSQLEEDHVSTIGNFQNAIDSCSKQLEISDEWRGSMQKLIEESLVRMTSAFISTNQHDCAISTLGMLCEMLPQYIVSYAKLLHLCGQEQFAVELLENYTNLFPKNRQAGFVLDQFYKTSTNPDISIRSPVYGKTIKDAMQAILGSQPDDIGKVA